MLIEKIDHVGLEPLQRGLGDLLDVLRPAVEAGLLPVGLDLEAELGGDDHLCAERRERLAHEFFVGERTVDFGGVEEGDAAFDGGPDQGDHLLLFTRPGRSQSSCPCSRGRGPTLPDCCFPFARLHCLYFSYVGLIIQI